MYFVSDTLLQSILSEDIPYGDATVAMLGIDATPGQIVCRPKADTVVCGVTLAQRLFAMAGLETERLVDEGDFVAAQTDILRATGAAGSVHAVYKTAQNILEYCSGIAARTRTMVDEACAGNPACRVVTTRKHFPGTKTLSLFAAQTGGALVHRMGLSESILIFDQHRVFTEPGALDDFAALKASDPERKVAVEADTPEAAIAFARAGADIVQCERLSPEQLRETIRAAKVENPAVLISAAGGVNADNARAYAAAGADFLVTSWPYFGRPTDIKMAISRA